MCVCWFVFSWPTFKFDCEKQAREVKCEFEGVCLCAAISYSFLTTTISVSRDRFGIVIITEL